MTEFRLGDWSLRPRCETSMGFENTERDTFVVIVHDCPNKAGLEQPEPAHCCCGMCIGALVEREMMASALRECYYCDEPIPEEIIALFVLRNGLVG